MPTRRSFPAVLLVLAACSRAGASGAPDASVSAAPAVSTPRAVASSAAPPAPPPWSPIAIPDPNDDEAPNATLPEQREALFRRMEHALELGPDRMATIRAIFEASPVIGQGNPLPTKHLVSRAECRKRREASPAKIPADARCGAKNMVPLYDPTAGETAADAKVCIDQFEFPDLPCDYPVVYARAREAALLCEAVGKRICDAHEWEGGCAGALKPAETEYAFGQRRPYATWLHNEHRQLVWAYGPKKDHTKCATIADKSPKCFAGGWTLCGSNTFPAGSFPECVSTLGVFDQHGNAAEHMNLPLVPEELASRGGTGQTEMKGSWFIFWRAEAHEDDCHWRAKDWHPSKLMDEDSHRNYHLGFRCCKNVDEPVDGGVKAESK